MPMPANYVYPGLDISAILAEIQSRITATPPNPALDLSLATIPYAPIPVYALDQTGKVLYQNGQPIISSTIAALTADQLTTRQANIAYLQGIAAGINAKTAATTVDVPVKLVRNTLLLMAQWAPIQQLATKGSLSGSNPPTAADSAFAAAVSLVQLLASENDEVQMSDTTVATAVKNMLAALVAAGVITQSASDALMAHSQSTVPWLSTVGWHEGVTFSEHDVEAILMGAS